jgi:hypothetical protein
MSFSLKNILDELEIIEKPTPDIEYGQLVSIYNKLIYIENNFRFDESFYNFLVEFLKEIDEKSIYYLESIVWDYNDDFYYFAKQIQKGLVDALYIDNIIDKLDLYIYSYKQLIEVAQDIRQEKVKQQIDDDDFLEKIKSKN